MLNIYPYWFILMGLLLEAIKLLISPKFILWKLSQWVLLTNPMVCLCAFVTQSISVAVRVHVVTIHQHLPFDKALFHKPLRRWTNQAASELLAQLRTIMDGYKRAASASRNHSLNPRLMSKATGAKVMATSFSIQDILSKKDKRHESTSPTAPQAQASPESSPDSGPQVSVLNDSSLQFGESSSRKRNREGSDASGSGCSSEGILCMHSAS